MDTHDVIHFPVAAGRPRRENAGREPARILDLETRRAARARATAAATHNRPLTIAEVWKALDEGRLTLHYQPQYDLDNGELLAAEGLVRLIDREGGLVYPDRFIELVEHSDLVVPLGRAVIERACADLVAVRAAGAVLPRVALNLSARQLNCDDELLAFLDQTLTSRGLAYPDLEFELTERQRLSAEGDGRHALEALANCGARITIDDFGIGYSSVVCLTELPIRAFKLDRALISRLPEDESIQSVVSCLLDLASLLDLDVVAEGVETRAQHEWLSRAGCPAAQGFGLARPVAVQALQGLLTETDRCHGIARVTCARSSLPV